MLSGSHRLTQGSETAPQTGLVSDPSSYQSRALSARDGSTAAIDAAARAFESLLVGQMLRQMRETALGDGLFDSAQTRLYQDLYDQQVATAVTEGEGMGIRKALLRQLAPELTEDSETRDARALVLPERNMALRSLKRRKLDAAAGVAATPGGASETRSASAGAGLSAAGQSKLNSKGQWPPKSAEDFVAYLKPYADQAAEVLGMDTSALLAQCALETGWGKHVPRHADGRSSFNLFGIKADRSWQGDKISVGTLEYSGGVARREQARFRSYDSPADSFIDYVAFLKRNPRYGEALKSESAEEFVRGLQEAGYATDPRYASKILGIRDRLLRISAALETQGAEGAQVSVSEADRSKQG